MAELAIFFEGLIISFGLLTAIGPQNAYVLRQGLRQRHSFAVTTTTFLSDSAMIALGVMGAGGLVKANEVLATYLGWAGVAFLLWFAVSSFRKALNPEVITKDSLEASAGDAAGKGVKTAILHALAFAWLNPWAYVDTMVLLGGVSTKYPEYAHKAVFMAGALIASAAWFYGLSATAKRAAPLFAKKVTWRILDSLITIIMLAIATTLALHQLEN